MPSEAALFGILKRLMAAALAGAACAGGAFQALRLAWADHLGRGADPRGWERAAALDPRNAEWRRRLAEYHDPTSARGAAELRAAVDQDPADASLHLALGLSAELRGELAAAEGELLRAARLSRLYEPRWTLANFYCRRGRAEPFWNWARQALEISYGDRAPLFRLCWRMDPQGGAMLERALPPRPDLWREYVGFLLAEQRLEPATAAAQRLAAAAAAADREAVLAVCDAWLRRGRPEPALSLWNRLCARQVLPYPPLDAVRGACLTNGRLTVAPLGAGFDWRLEAPRGVALLADSAAGELRVSFSGRQPESCGLFWQYVPVVPGSRYRLSFEYRTERVGPETGVYWSARDAVGGSELAGPGRDLSSEAWISAGMDLRVPLGSRLVRVGVFYRRRPGTVRSEGSVWFRQIALRLLP